MCPEMSAQSYQGRTEFFIPPLSFMHDAQGHTVRRSLIPMQTVSWPHSLGDVTFTGVAQGTELMPFSPVRILDVAHRD